MDLIFILITLWVLVETIMFLLKNGSASDLDIDTDNDNDTDLTYDLSGYGNDSYDSSELSQNEGDSGVVSARGRRYGGGGGSGGGGIGSGTFSKPNHECQQINRKRRRQLLLAKRLARRDRDRQIVLTYFQNSKHDITTTTTTSITTTTTRSNNLNKNNVKNMNDNGYDSDSDYETSQAELVELYVKMAEHIRWRRIVGLYDLSYKFQLTTEKTREYLGKLQVIGLLHGVCDDRGKFIYVAHTELTVVSKFIQEQNLYDWPQTGLI